MKILIILALLDGLGPVTKISKENLVKKEAEAAFTKGNYKEAIAKFHFLIDSLKTGDNKAVLNLGHAYYKTNDLPAATKNYEKLYVSDDKKIKSVAAQQLGIISYKADNDKEKALAYFKEALRANPDNAEARYNYELLKKIPEKKEDPKMNQDKKDEQKKEDQKKEQEKKDEQNKDKKDGKEKQDQQGKDGDKNKPNNEKDKQDNKDKKDGKNGKDKKDGKDGKDQQGKDGDKGDKKDKGEEDKKKNGSDKEKEGGDKEKEEQDKAKQDKEGKSGEGKDDKKEGKENEAGQAKKEQKGGKKDKDKIVANPEALSQMGLTEQRAKALLNAMKSGEVQYIQQMRRDSPTKKHNKKGKPDW